MLWTTLWHWHSLPSVLVTLAIGLPSITTCHIWQALPQACLSGMCLTRQTPFGLAQAVSCSPTIPPLLLLSSMVRWQAYIPTVWIWGLGERLVPTLPPATAKAIRRHQDDFVSSFPSDIKELQFYFGDDKSDKVRAYPAKGLNVPLYILGSSPESAYLAAELGLPYAFASHFAPRFLTQAVEIYRKEFKPSDVLDKPKVIVGLNAIVADTDSEAKLLATTSLQFFLNVVTGERSGMKPPVPDIESRIPPHILSMAKSMTACSVIGSPKTVKAQLEQLQKQVNADEFMVVSYIYDKDKQARSYELILEAVDG